MKNVNFILFIVSFLLFFSCKTKNEPVNDGFTGFDRQAMLGAVAVEVIIPSYKEFNQNAALLVLQIDSFNLKPSSESLIKTQDAWKMTNLAWKRCEAFKIGPAVENFLAKQIQDDKLDISFSEIEKNITNGISELNSAPTTVKGLNTLEYLLFHSSGSQDSVLVKFSNSNRKSYLRLTAANLVSNSDLIISKWDSYLPTFRSQDGRDIASSLSLLVNQIIFLSEQIRDQKLGLPLGKSSNGISQPNKVESKLSKQSINTIKNNLISIKRSFRSLNLKSEDKSGIDDLVNSMQTDIEQSQKLSSKIENKINELISQLDKITLPLDQAIIVQSVETEKAYVISKELVVLLRADLVNFIGINVTLSDNDGD